MESIPSLSQSPEPGRRGDPDTVLPAERPLEDLRLQLDQLGWAARGAGSGEDSATSSSTPLENEEPDGLEAIEANKGEISEVGGGCVAREGGSSRPSLSVTPDTNPQLRLAQALRSHLEVLTPQPSPSSGTPRAHTPSPPRSQDSNSNSGPDEPLLNEEGERWRPLEQDDPITAQCGDSTDQSEFALEPLLLGKHVCDHLGMGRLTGLTQDPRTREKRVPQVPFTKGCVVWGFSPTMHIHSGN